MKLTHSCLVVISADYNDGDYVSANYVMPPDQVNRLCDIMFKLLPFIQRSNGNIDYKAIAWNKHEEWQEDYSRMDPPQEMYKEILTQDEIEFLHALVPTANNEECGVHSIHEIKYYMLVDPAPIEIMW